MHNHTFANLRSLGLGYWVKNMGVVRIGITNKINKLIPLKFETPLPELIMINFLEL